jgi:hypothetical protein
MLKCFNGNDMAGTMRVAPAGAPCHYARVARMTTDARIGRRGFVVGSVAVLATAGCAAHPADLSFWAMSYQGDYAPFLMTEFTAATGLTVDVQSLPWTASHEKLLTAFAGDALPDVLMLPNGWVDEFAMIGAIRPLPSRAMLDGVFPGAGPDTRTPHAVPWSVAPRVQVFRRDLLAAAGWDAPARDWDGWRRMATALKRRRPDDYVFLFLLNWPDDLLTMFTQVGGRVLRERDTRGNFATPEGRFALAYYRGAGPVRRLRARTVRDLEQRADDVARYASTQCRAAAGSLGDRADRGPRRAGCDLDPRRVSVRVDAQPPSR